MSWLWRQNDSSAASFEKALARLSTQISSATVSLDKTRSRSRRAKALWTLYTSLAYLVSALILGLVIGPHSWGLPHYGGLAAGPLLIYGVRQAITSIFGWQISRQQAHVDRLQKQRAEKIADLKKATKYDSTQELLQKYGGVPPKPVEERQKQDTKKSSKEQPQQHIQRTGIPPPPTANIPGRRHPVSPPSPQQQHPSPSSLLSSPTSFQQSPVGIEEPGFAPNAFPQPPPPSMHSLATYEHTSHWYDRILDVMLGEDETIAKNRLVLLCQNCRLVNGQAPPGVKTLEELGRWRCQSCGAWNGTQAEVAKAVQEMTGRNQKTSPITHAKHENEEADTSAVPENQAAEEKEGTSGADHSVGTNTATKRLTRSAGKPETEGI